MYFPTCLSGEHRNKFPGQLSFRTAADGSNAKMKLGKTLRTLTWEDGFQDLSFTEATYWKFTQIYSNYADIRIPARSGKEACLCVYVCNYLSEEYGRYGNQGLVEVDCRLKGKGWGWIDQHSRYIKRLVNHCWRVIPTLGPIIVSYYVVKRVGHAD